MRWLVRRIIEREIIMTKSTLTMTKPSRSRVALIEGDERFETAAILASTSPLGITAMGAFPLSLIALGRITRRYFDDTLTLRPKKTMSASEEIQSPPEIEIASQNSAHSSKKPIPANFASLTISSASDY